MSLENQQKPVWLVAHDFSSCAESAADLAIDDLLDSKRGGRIALVHVYTVLLPGAAIEGGALAAGYGELERSAMTEATRGLERIADRLRARAKSAGAAIEIDVVARMGTPAEAILEEATRLHAARIVVGTHGRTGVTHMLLGSVAERVARRAQVPVVVAHAAGDKERA